MITTGQPTHQVSNGGFWFEEDGELAKRRRDFIVDGCTPGLRLFAQFCYTLLLGCDAREQGEALLLFSRRRNMHEPVGGEQIVNPQGLLEAIGGRSVQLPAKVRPRILPLGPGFHRVGIAHHSRLGAGGDLVRESPALGFQP